jgi:hypothetical protein
MRYNSPILFGLGLLVTAAFGTVIGWGCVKRVEVPRAGVWEDTPVLCARDVPTPVVIQAVDWWRVRGHDLTLSCHSWTISLDADPTVDTRASYDDVAVTHGVTVAHVDEGVVVAAEIRVLPGASSLVVAHELGHALGYLHPQVCPTGHMMHPHNPGWDDRGLDLGPVR